MINLIRKNANKIIPAFVLLILILVSFWHFNQGNAERIRNQNEEYVGEFTLQRAISIDSMIEENLHFIESTAYLFGNSMGDERIDIRTLREFEENGNFDYLRFIDRDGDDYTSTGIMANLKDRDYFKAGMRGESGITYVSNSRVTGERQIGFYAPVRYQDEIIGVMVGFYGEQYLQRMLSYELFEYEGEGWLCTRSGDVIGSTLEGVPENYLTYLNDTGKTTAEENAGVSEALSSGENTPFTYQEDGKDIIGYMAPLAHDEWVLIRSFPGEASETILNNANREGEALLFKLILLFLAYIVLLVVLFLIDQRNVREKNRDANDVAVGVRQLFDKFVSIDTGTRSYHYITGMPLDGIEADGAYEDIAEAISALVPEESRREEAKAFLALEHIQSLLQEEESANILLHAPRGGKEWFSYNFTVLSRNEEHIPDRMLFISQDVSSLHEKELFEQQRLQEALDAAEHASRAKTEFLFNMSHDLRTPMNAIIGYTELAQQEQVTEAEVKDYIHKIDSSSQHLLALINDILEMSRIESGKMTLEPGPTDLREVLDEVRGMFETQMAGKSIVFEVTSSDLADPLVCCDKNRLDRVLLNLVSNAFKFTPEGGRVTVTLRQTGREEGRGCYDLSVRDSGIGMSPEFAEKLFTPFERERTSTVSGIQGTGLGLSITKSIVDLMGGSIDVKTEQGKGTEFLVYLAFPTIEEMEGSGEEGTAGESAEEEAVVFSDKRLLLTEDNPINREIASMILSNFGFGLETAENGQEAVDKVASAEPGHFDAVLMDIQMPVMDGYTAARAIRALPDPAKSGIPIIAMTANAFREDIEAAREAGMNGHIAKPLEVDKMIATLTEVLRG